MTWALFQASGETYIAKTLFNHILFGIKVRADRGKELTKTKEEQFGDVLGAVESARNEKIGTHLRRRVR